MAIELGRLGELLMRTAHCNLGSKESGQRVSESVALTATMSMKRVVGLKRAVEQ
jgi:hypothetical protein